jgi:hypothetical protein
VLLRYKPEGFDQVYGQFKDKDGYYIGFMAIAFSYLSNNSLVPPDQAPRSALDFLDAKYKGKLTITWRATDKNLLPYPITLKYAKDREGPWTEIASGLENSGRYVWTLPPAAPWQMWIRVEAADRAGNVGAADTPTPVKVDLAQPRGIILDAEPAARDGFRGGLQ